MARPFSSPSPSLPHAAYRCHHFLWRQNPSNKLASQQYDIQAAHNRKGRTIPIFFWQRSNGISIGRISGFHLSHLISARLAIWTLPTVRISGSVPLNAPSGTLKPRNWRHPSLMGKSLMDTRGGFPVARLDDETKPRWQTGSPTSYAWANAEVIGLASWDAHPIVHGIFLFNHIYCRMKTLYIYCIYIYIYVYILYIYIYCIYIYICK